MLVFEDLHWIDPTPLSLLEQLMRLIDQAPVALIGVFRPWRQEPSWRFHEAAIGDYAHRYHSVALERLDDESSRELVAELLHVEDLPEKVRGSSWRKRRATPSSSKR